MKYAFLSMCNFVDSQNVFGTLQPHQITSTLQHLESSMHLFLIVSAASLMAFIVTLSRRPQRKHKALMKLIVEKTFFMTIGYAGLWYITMMIPPEALAIPELLFVGVPGIVIPIFLMIDIGEPLTNAFPPHKSYYSVRVVWRGLMLLVVCASAAYVSLSVPQRSLFAIALALVGLILFTKEMRRWSAYGGASKAS